MMWFDYLAIIVFGYFIIRGLMTGFIRGVFSLAGAIFGFLFAGQVGSRLMPIVKSWNLFPPQFIPWISIGLAFLLVYFGFVLVGFLLRSVAGALHLGFFDRLLGGFLGFLKGVVILTLIYILIGIASPSAVKNLKKSKTYPIIKYTIYIGSKIFPSHLRHRFKPAF